MVVDARSLQDTGIGGSLSVR